MSHSRWTDLQPASAQPQLPDLTSGATPSALSCRVAGVDKPHWLLWLLWFCLVVGLGYFPLETGESLALGVILWFLAIGIP